MRRPAPRHIWILLFLYDIVLVSMNKSRFLLGAVITWAAIILVWHVTTEYGLVSSVMIPSPKAVIQKFVEIARNGYNNISLLTHIYVSFKRLFIAIILAILTAVPLGLVSGYSQKVKSVIDSLIHFYRPIPPLGYYTLLVIWMGIDNSSKIMLLYLAAFAPIYLICAASVSEVKREYLLSAISLGASKKDLFTKVVFPASLPRIFTGIRTAIGFAYTTLVSAEMVAATSGLGWMVLDASRYLKTDVIFIGIIIMGVSGIIIDSLIGLIEKKYIFWKGK